MKFLIAPIQLITKLTFGAFTDIDLGNAFDDYIGCNVQGGFYYGYNGTDYERLKRPDAHHILQL